MENYIFTSSSGTTWRIPGNMSGSSPSTSPVWRPGWWTLLGCPSPMLSTPRTPATSPSSPRSRASSLMPRTTNSSRSLALAPWLSRGSRRWSKLDCLTSSMIPTGKRVEEIPMVTRSQAHVYCCETPHVWYHIPVITLNYLFVPSLLCKDGHGLEAYCFRGKVVEDVVMYFEHHLSGAHLPLQTDVSYDVGNHGKHKW